MSDIVKSIEKIKQDMNDIYDDIYSISCVEDIQDMLGRIQLVCQKGIPQTDLADFEELKKALEAFLADITALTDCQDDRNAFEAQYSTLLKQYADDEFDFDVVSIIEQVGQSIRDSMEAKDLAWRSRYLEPMLNGRVELLSWVDKTRLLPKYLSEETLQSYYERKKDVDQQLSQAKIDDVIYSFRKLEEKEKEACFDQLVDIYKNGRENTNDIDLPFTRNKKWDLEEWIVLVKVYFEHKDKSRSELNELLSPLSLMLVRRAGALGIEHDEKYRNINGLAMQFDRIKYMDTKGAKGLSAYSELAEAALEMYHTDREGFELIAKKCWDKYGAN